MISVPSYPDLPVTAHREEFLNKIRSHAVVIVQADTGSGKSTQLPKFLLEAGLHERGRIGVTQPRRIAALSIADRLREELQDASLVSARIRFLEEGNAKAPIKVMTDGILLQEFRRDRLLRQYSCILLDEAHERSLNIDILLGICRNILDKRPEFRLVIASATLDTDLFRDFFPGSATLHAAGRLFPVSVEYRPPAERKEKNRGDSGLLPEAEEAILSLESEHPDHLLCFLPTERDIQDLADALREKLDAKRFDVLPLFGRLSPQEQRRIFQNSGRVKIILATNIAETSLTIPGIAYVVDTGLARISRYNPQSRIQGLPVEPIAQASARQRMGRAGRVKPGRCIRLYSEKDLTERPAYTDPEILRSNLANVVLQLKSLNLNPENFPFIQSPPRQAFRGACRQLHELGALETPELNAPVTTLGQEMARLPMDVALSAVLLRARDMGCLHSALIIATGLCIQDPRVIPAEGPDKEKARATHRQLGGFKSDFLVLLNLWNHLHQEWAQGSLNQLRRVCEKLWLHFLRVREWMDLYEQFCGILQVSFAERTCSPDSFHRDHLHMALLSGFLGGIARRDAEKSCYKLIGGREAHLFPGSDLYGKHPEWVVAAEIRETSRVFLARCAEIRPEWIIRVAGHFCTRRWYDPVWNPQRGFVEAAEEVQFRGMVISRGKRVDYSRIDPTECARIFWREAIIEGQVPRPFPFMEHNARLLEHLRAQEAVQRRWGLAPDQDMLIEWYMRQAPEVNSLPSLKQFLHRHGDTALRQQISDWVHLEQSAVSSASRPLKTGFQLRDTLPATPSAPGSSKPDLSGGAREIFEISGIPVPGTILFDNKNPRDGLSLELPAHLWRITGPAALARALPPWRHWILDSILSHLPASLRESVSRDTLLEERWLDMLEKDPNQSPLRPLIDIIRRIPALQTQPLRFAREFHLNLHLRLEKYELELSPETDRRGFFLQSRDLAPLRNLWILDHDLAWGPRLEGTPGKLRQTFAYQEPELALWWEDWFRRLAEPEFLQTDQAKYLAEKIRSLLSLAGQSPAEESVGTLWLLRRLGADCQNMSAAQIESALPRFHGLEGQPSRKLADFSALATTIQDHHARALRALARLTLAAACLGFRALTAFWKQLSEAHRAVRRGQSPDIGYHEWELPGPDMPLEHLIAQVCIHNPECARSPWPQSLDSRHTWLEERAEFEKTHRKRWRTWCEQARKKLPKNNKSLEELRQAIRVLENPQTDFQEGAELFIRQSTQCATLELQILKDGREDAPESITREDLQRLKQKFSLR